jgi:predicted enzyme related to lactoylglutathione lyase
MPHGSITWAELTTPDVERAKAHYAAVAGWTYEGFPMEDETYWVASADGTTIAGIFSGKSIPYPVPPHWLIYLEVDDIAAAVAAVRATGGSVLREPFPVPGVGTIAIVKEPGGAAAGLMQRAAG